MVEFELKKRPTILEFEMTDSGKYQTLTSIKVDQTCLIVTQR